MKRFLFCIMLLVLTVACASPSPQNNAAQNNSDPLAGIANAYPTWARMFDAPRNVSMQLMLLCRTMNTDEQAYVESEHAQYFVQVYVNPAGEKVMREQGTRVFPEGTIVVKEKWKRDASFAQDISATKPAGLGIMHKVNGAWQYAYMDETGKLTRDQKQLEHCRACHVKQQVQDSVFYPQVIQE